MLKGPGVLQQEVCEVVGMTESERQYECPICHELLDEGYIVLIRKITEEGHQQQYHAHARESGKVIYLDDVVWRDD